MRAGCEEVQVRAVSYWGEVGGEGGGLVIDYWGGGWGWAEWVGVGLSEGKLVGCVVAHSGLLVET